MDDVRETSCAMTRPKRPKRPGTDPRFSRGSLGRCRLRADAPIVDLLLCGLDGSLASLTDNRSVTIP